MFTRRALISFALLWLAGAGLRVTVLAVPPVIPLIHADLHLTETQIGILTGLPSLLFALAAVPGSLAIARLGAVAALVIGLVIDGVGAGLRGAAPSTAWLYAATIAMGAGIAIAQPALPPIVRAWLPGRIGLATAVYSNGYVIGATLAVALSIPVVLPLVGSWRLGFVVWAVPVIASAFLIAVLAPRPAVPGDTAPRAATRWWPDWRSSLLWRLGLMFGSNNSIYFTTNAFLSEYLGSTGRSDLITPALTALNIAQIPMSFLLIAAARRVENRRWPHVASGLGVLAGILGIVFTGDAFIVAAAALVGFALTVTFVLTLALPAFLSAPGDIHRLSAGMFTISYSTAVIVPTLSGLAWDLTGIPAAAFAPLAVCAIAIAALAPTLPIGRRKPDA